VNLDDLNTQHTGDIMSNKTPFELRFDVLQLAKHYLDSIYASECRITEQVLQHSNEVSGYDAKQLKAIKDEMLPKVYSTADLLEKAAELYVFIENRPLKGTE